MNEQEFLANIKEQLDYLVHHGKHVNVIFIANVDDFETDRSETFSVLFGKYVEGAMMLVDIFKKKTYFRSCVEYALAHLPSRTSPTIRFTADELDIIRDILGEQLKQIYIAHPELEQSSYDDCLPIINKIQARFLCPEFENVRQFVNNTSDKWTEIVEAEVQ